MSNYVTNHGEIISLETRQLISKRYHTITKAINKEFWSSISDTNHSLYVGSYGRYTAIDDSDIDILVELPEDEYNRYDIAKGNGQSRLLQAVKDAILDSYPKSNIKADGQVVVVNFSDGMKFEVLPAFKNLWFEGFKYPDTNMGGNWLTTNPKAEQESMKSKNESSNGLFRDTCKHIRRIHVANYSSYHLSGIVIDSFIYDAIGGWQWAEGNGEGGTAARGEYEQHLLDYFEAHTWNDYFTGKINMSLKAPGSNLDLDTKSSNECLGKILKEMVG